MQNQSELVWLPIGRLVSCNCRRVLLYIGPRFVEDFEETRGHLLAKALLAAQRALNGKPAIELASRLRASHESVKDKNWESLPKLPPREDLEVEEYYRVVVKHKATGIVVIKESKRPIFARLLLDARVDLAEAVDVIEITRELP